MRPADEACSAHESHFDTQIVPEFKIFGRGVTESSMNIKINNNDSQLQLLTQKSEIKVVAQLPKNINYIDQAGDTVNTVTRFPNDRDMGRTTHNKFPKVDGNLV